MKSQNTTNLLTPLITSFLLTFISTIIVYFFFKFEIALLFAVCLGIAILVTGIVGLENTITKKQ